MKSLFTICLSLILTIATCSSQNIAPVKHNIGKLEIDVDSIAREVVIADIDSIVNYIRNIHPDMFAICPEEEFMREVEETKRSLPRWVKRNEVFRLIGHLVPMLGDGHTSLFPELIYEPGDALLFPYQVEINPSDSTIIIAEDGRQVISINDIPAKEICATLSRNISGETSAYRIGGLGTMYFPFYMTVLYPAPEYTIVYNDDGVEGRETTQGKPATEIKNVKFERKGIFEYAIHDDISTCVLDFRQFDEPERFAVFLKDMFTEMQRRNISNLVIDLRNNPGGSSMLGDELFQYISPTPFMQFGAAKMRITQTVRETYPDWGLSPVDTITHIVVDASELIPLRENPLRFAGRGNVYLLTSVKTFSSASGFSWAFHYFKMGTIVGEETGGRIVSFGDAVIRPLPNIPVRVGSSWKKFYGYGATDAEMHGVIPDYVVPADKALDFTLNAIKTNQFEIPALNRTNQ